MASALVSEDPRPVGPLPRPRSSADWSNGHRSVFNGVVWWMPQAPSLYADTFNFQALAGLKEIMTITFADQGGEPLMIFASLRVKTEGAGESLGRAIPRIRADLRFQNFSVPTITAHAVAATIRVHRERKWRVGVLWSLDIHYQPRKPLQSGTTKDEGQVFDKMLTPDLYQNRVLVSFSDQKKCPGKASDRRHNSHGSGADLHEHVFPDLTNVRCRGAAHSSKENSERFTACPSEQEPKEPAQNVPSVRVKPSLSKQGSAISAFINEGVNLQQASFQIQIILLTGKTLLLEVQPSLTVRQLSKILEQRLGIPSSLLRLLFVGKQLDNNMPLSFYNIERNATVILSLRLRGGAVGQSSASKGFSYKDAVHAQPAKESAQSTEAPKPFLVDKMEETPAIEINHPSLDDQHQTFAESALICRFNGLWPRTADLYQWIHSNWTKYCKVFFCSKGFFIVVLAFNEDYQKALTGGPWFWGSAGLFLSPWFPDFDPSTAVISKLPIWVRLPNLPAHLWHFAVFQGIGNTLGRFLATDTSRGETGIYTYGRICAEIDISKGLPDQIILKVGDFHWTQTLDYENTAFRCRHCHQTGHLQNSCAAFLDKKKNFTRKSKSKSWKPCARPPMDDIESSSSDEDDIEAEEENLEHPEDSPSACAKDPSAPLLSQKRTHESSPSDSDKESPPSAQICLQVVPVQPDQIGWVKVSKKKGKKCRLEDSAHAG